MSLLGNRALSAFQRSGTSSDEAPDGAFCCLSIKYEVVQLGNPRHVSDSYPLQRTKARRNAFHPMLHTEFSGRGYLRNGWGEVFGGCLWGFWCVWRLYVVSGLVEYGCVLGLYWCWCKGFKVFGQNDPLFHGGKDGGDRPTAHSLSDPSTFPLSIRLGVWRTHK